MRKGSQSRSKKSVGKSVSSRRTADKMSGSRPGFSLYPIERTPYSPNRRFVPKAKTQAQSASFSLPNNPKVMSALRSRVAQVYRAPTQARVSMLSTPSTPTFSKLNRAFTCLGRAARRELVFASGGVGKGRTYPNRRSPSKEKC